MSRQQWFGASLFKVVLHDLRAFKFLDREFFEHGAIARNPGRTAFNTLGGYFQMGQKNRKGLQSGEDSSSSD